MHELPGPFFLNLLLDVIGRGGDQTIGYVYASAMAVGLIFGAICDNQHFQRVVRAGASHPRSMCTVGMMLAFVPARGASDPAKSTNGSDRDRVDRSPDLCVAQTVMERLYAAFTRSGLQHPLRKCLRAGGCSAICATS